MTIEKDGPKYIPTCDNCYLPLLPENTFGEARNAIIRAGWTRTRVNGEWENYCPECAEEMEGWEE